MTTSKIPNRLIHEKSPYLLQHAYNPVNWYPWCEEAFAKAKNEDKPIFLSIGYSTCHWCHVMAHESFEDREVSEVLNQYFVSIKVDREERPDIDSIYMNVCQALTGRGGWPLTIFMTEDKKPFFAGTYFPKKDKMGMQGFLTILEGVRQAWANNKAGLLNSSRQILNEINKSENMKGKEIDTAVIEEAFFEFQSDFDRTYGGFGNAPKFPTPQNLYFLLRYWYKTKKEAALTMVERTLDSMYRGGIFDHIGFGFSRYSTDRKWLIPHFEKMLYDNALIAIAYLETYQVTKKNEYKEAADQILTYVLRDMTSGEGGFFSAEDADSEGEEGKFYVWTPDEIRSVLGKEEGSRFCEYYNITEEGNFEGKSTPNLIGTDLEKEESEFLNNSREKLFQHRNRRIHPYKDDKVLTGWNGLMIAAMAIGGRVLKNRNYTLAAANAVSFISEKLIRGDGRLLARYRDGEAAIPGFLDDYAFLIWGLIELYETTYKAEYLEKAMFLNEDLIKYFWDNKNGGLFLNGEDGEQLITRPKEIYDGATPSGNSVAAANFIRLARLTGEYELENKAKQLLHGFGSRIQNYPKGHAFSLISILFMVPGSKEIVIVSKKKDRETEKMTAMVHERFLPFTTSVLYTEDHQDIKGLASFLSGYHAVEGRTTAYICENFSCQAPINDADLLEQVLDEKEQPPSADNLPNQRNHIGAEGINSPI